MLNNDMVFSGDHVVSYQHKAAVHWPFVSIGSDSRTASYTRQNFDTLWHIKSLAQPCKGVITKVVYRNNIQHH